jgi:cell wall-associated NlpC family hydrolase
MRTSLWSSRSPWALTDRRSTERRELPGVAHGSRRPALRVAALLCTVVAAVGLTGGGAAAEPQGDLDQVRAQVDRLNQKMAEATDRYNEAVEAVGEGRARVQRARVAVAEQQRTLDELTQQMGGYAAAMYRQGGVDPAVQTFLADDPADFLAQSSTVDVLVDQQLSSLAAVAAERSRLTQREADVDEQLDLVKAAQTAAATERAGIDADLARSQRLLASLETAERERLARERAARARAAAAERDAFGVGPDDELAGVDVPASGRGAVAVRFALAQLGEPYRYGAAGPDAWDCSGLTSAAWRAAGVSLSRSSRAQTGDGAPVSRASLRPGDLVFFYSPVSHVGLYLGGGRVVHAPHPGDVVSIDALSSMPYAGAVRPG